MYAIDPQKVQRLFKYFRGVCLEVAPRNESFHFDQLASISVDPPASVQCVPVYILEAKYSSLMTPA